MIARRSFLRLIGGAGAVLACGPRLAFAQDARVRVARAEPVVTRTQFDPRRPPPGMPKITPPESGVCNTTFELETDVSYSAEVVGRGMVRVLIQELDLVTHLTIDIYTIEDAPQKLVAHEEAHRAIAEYYYAGSAAAAAAAGHSVLEMTFDGTGRSRAAAQEDGFEKALAALERAYMDRTRVRSAAANVRFDEITRHGLSDIDESEALAAALAADPEPHSA